MSYRSHGLGFLAPTGGSLPLALPVNQAKCVNGAASSPKENAVVVPARQAYSHSASDGKRISSSSLSNFRRRSSSVTLRQKRFASCQSIISTELRGPFQRLGFLPTIAS